MAQRFLQVQAWGSADCTVFGLLAPVVAGPQVAFGRGSACSGRSDHAELAQVMVLTHPKSAVELSDTYLAETLYPAQPVWFYGRSVTLQPAVAPEAAVSSWWLDWGRAAGAAECACHFVSRC